MTKSKMQATVLKYWWIQQGAVGGAKVSREFHHRLVHLSLDRREMALLQEVLRK